MKWTLCLNNCCVVENIINSYSCLKDSFFKIYATSVYICFLHRPITFICAQYPGQGCTVNVSFDGNWHFILTCKYKVFYTAMVSKYSASYFLILPLSSLLSFYIEVLVTVNETSYFPFFHWCIKNIWKFKYIKYFYRFLTVV